MPAQLAGFALAVTLVAVSCAPAPSPGSGVTQPAVVRIAWADVGVPTPFRISVAGPGGAALLTLLYDTLTWKDEHGVIPWLATAWEVSPDAQDYTFTLAPHVNWQDGQPLTAEDIAFSFDYYTRHPYPWTSTAMVESTTVVAPDRVRIHLREPYAAFLEDVAGSVPILPRHVWLNVSRPETYDGPDASLGSGPYRLAEYRSAEGAYRLVANPSYFRGPVLVPEIQQLNISSEALLSSLQQGQVDLGWTTNGAVLDLLKNDPRLKVLQTVPLSIVRLAVNTERAPLDRREVRQAIMYALDRAGTAQVLTQAPPLVGSAGVVPPGTFWFNPNLPTYPFDPQRARALLGGQTLSLEMLADPTNREPDLMEPQLQAVGIKLTTRRVDGKTRSQLLQDGEFQLAIVQHIGIGADPDYLRRWYSGEEANDYAQGSIFSNPEYEELAKEQAAELNVNRRKELVFRMQDILADQLPTIPLYYRPFYWVYDSTKYTPINTYGGLMNGIPFVQNKLTFLQR